MKVSIEKPVKYASTKKNRICEEIIVLLVLIIFAIAILLPITWTFLSAFRPKSQIIEYPPTYFPKSFTILNFLEVLKRIKILKYAANSAIFAIFTAFPGVLINAMAGYAFARLQFKGKNVLFTICLMTMMIPFQVTMIPLFILIYRIGIYDTWPGLILPRLANVMSVFMMRSFFMGLPKELEEAGRIDGAKELTIFWKIMLPLTKPAMVTLIVLGVNGAWNDLLYPLLMTSDVNMRMISNGVAMFVGTDVSNYGAAFAAGVISMLPMLLLYIFGQRYFVEGTVTSGLKG